MDDNFIHEFQNSFTIQDDEEGPDIIYLESHGPKEVYRELSEFVFYFSQEVTSQHGRVGDFYTLVSNTLTSNNLGPDREHYWRSDLNFFAETIFNLCKPDGKEFERMSRLELKELINRNKEAQKHLEMKGIPAELAELEIIRRSDVEDTLHLLMKKMPKPHQKMGLWCMGSRHVKEKYHMNSPKIPDFGRVIYNKAVRLNLEQFNVIPPSAPPPKRPLPVDDDGKYDKALILSNWEKDTRKKECTSKEIAASFLDEADTFLNVFLPRESNDTIRANARKLQCIYCDEFPELYHFLDINYNSFDDLPEHLKKIFREMPLPDQTNYVERLRAKVSTHHVLGGILNDTFLKQLNIDIRRGITEPMYDGWAQVFQLRDKTKNMSLLKMVIQMSYLLLFIDSYQGDKIYTERMQIASQATKRLQEVCDTHILSPHKDSIELSPAFL